MCFCGKIGCLETVASGRTLISKAKEDLGHGTKSLLHQLTAEDLTKISLPLILEAAEAGDQYAIGLISESGMRLGKGISTLIHLFNPELIILGGEMSKARYILLDPIQQNLNKYCIPRIRQDADVVISELGPDAGLMGTVALVMDQVFEPKS
ncbi:MAG: ROK family protein [Bacteroidetes bacterium]|nr:ROK family protein [Bacteroidota bacterium]